MFSKLGKEAEGLFNNAKDSVNIDFGFVESVLTNFGFVVSKVEVQISIPPKVILEIDYKKSEFKREDINNYLEKEQENGSIKVIKKIISLLDQVFEFKDKFKFQSKEVKFVTVEVGLIPSISLIYEEV